MARNDAYAMLPADAAWSCSFGYPGEGGFNEYYRTASGERWIISNGPWDAFPLDWQCKRVGD